MSKPSARLLLLPSLLVAALCPAPPSLAEAELVSFGSTWSYLDDGSDQGTAWRALGFDDASWSTGAAAFGYGYGYGLPLVTLLDYGPDPDDRYITYYFRKTLLVPDASLYVKLKLLIWRHDGAVVYLNGTEIYRGNMPADPVDSETRAHPASDAEEKFTFTRAVDPSLLVSGDNVIAAELHKSRPFDNHAGFDLSLVGGTSSDEPSVVRGPYLQHQTTDAITLKWRTDFLTDSVVRYGPQPDELTSEVIVSGSRGDHSVRLSGLETDTTYYYSVGTSTAVLVGDDVDHRFRTMPPIGAAGHYRVWITGDSGTPGPNIDAVRDAYQAHVAGEQTNVWLLLGDNAYGSGTDDQYSVSFFTSFSELLRNTVAWPVLGNHGQVSSSLDTQQGPFFDIFDLPAAGEAGGVASQTESHYSFDYGNIHFIGLRSGQTATNTAQRQWLEADLATNEQDWTIVYLHILPYSKGSHDSDEGTNQVRIRLVPVFDAYGVDLMFSGHSHGYERSFLVKGHVGKSDTLEPSMLVDGGDGDPDGDGAYQKFGIGPVPNQGVVYTVAGSAATLNSAPYDHPVMVSSHESLGSVVLDIGSNTLDAKFIAQDGSVLDHFQIHKHTVDVPALRPIAQILLCVLVALGSANLLLRRRRRAGRGGPASRPAA